jgi:hypothetical protein
MFPATGLCCITTYSNSNTYSKQTSEGKKITERQHYLIELLSVAEEGRHIKVVSFTFAMDDLNR